MFACTNNVMGLFNLVRKLRRRDGEVKVLVMGIDKAGKTSAIRGISCVAANSKPPLLAGIAPTQGFAISTVYHHQFKFNLWDLGGRK